MIITLARSAKKKRSKSLSNNDLKFRNLLRRRELSIVSNLQLDSYRTLVQVCGRSLEVRDSII